MALRWGRGGDVTLVIGTDEAGYGPNLGPLVVAATAWQLAAAPEAVESVLAAAVAQACPLRMWGDSKAIYRGGAGLAPLERGVLVATSLAGVSEPTNWASLVSALGITMADPPPEGETLQAIRVPRHEHTPGCAALAAGIHGHLEARGVRLTALRCRVVQPAEFNAQLDRGLNKSDILSAVTLDLAAGLADKAGDEPIVIWCDRHGGRRRYAAQVSRAFGGALVSPLEETPTQSRYAIGSRRWIEFSVGGESRTPVAVASMAAKYVRELSMLAFNSFWAGRQANLAATAGYPVDASRWRGEAQAAVDREGLGWDTIWRRA